MTRVYVHEQRTSGVHGVTGDIVGTGGAQTLTSKTFSSPDIRLVTETITGDGAATIQSGRCVLTKGSAAAITLAAPTANQSGIELTFIAGSAFAHVITATGLIDDGVTGGSKNTCTLGAFVGASATFMAYNLKWTLKCKTVATIA